MKTTIKTLIALLLVTNAFAIDRIVQENGPAGTFPTISAAITAAVDGDRIIIYPKIGDNPYIENITIDKSLEIASAQDAVRYKIQGNVIITALNNRTVSIVGAQLVSGSISGASSGWRTNVNIMGCLLDGGDITFNNQYYTNIVSNILNNGSITISHGKIIGNDMMNEERLILINNSTSLTDDTMSIIANKVSRILCTSNIFLNIYNNFIKRTSVNYSTNAHSIEYSFVSSQNKLNIINNTIITPYSDTPSNSRAKYMYLASPGIIKNNIIQASAVNTSLYAPNAAIVASGISSSYNYFMNNVVAYSAFSATDVGLTTIPTNQNTGQLILPTLAQNGADPSFEFYDLDLTAGDAGCYGGSYTLDNYFPITGSSRVYNIDMPFGITTTGAPLNIKADGFDR